MRPFLGTLTDIYVLYTGFEYKLGCEAAMKVRNDDSLERAHSFARFLRESPSFRTTFWEHLQKWVLYIGLVYKLGCKAAMKVRDDDTLEGAHSFARFLRESPSFHAIFWELLQ